MTFDIFIAPHLNHIQIEAARLKATTEALLNDPEGPEPVLPDALREQLQELCDACDLVVNHAATPG